MESVQDVPRPSWQFESAGPSSRAGAMLGVSQTTDPSFERGLAEAIKLEAQKLRPFFAQVYFAWLLN